VIYIVSAYACIWINAWLLILVQCTDGFVYCSLLYTNLLVRSVETVGEYRSNGFLISFERFVKTVRKGVKFFVLINSSVRIFHSKRLKRFEDPLKRFDKAFTIRSLSVFLPVLMQDR
jgi:hypothetical protein